MKYNSKEIKLLFPAFLKSHRLTKHSSNNVRKLYGDEVEVINKLLPSHPVTGHADTFITMFFKTISDEERDLLGKFMINKPVLSSPSQISDSELMDLLPSRNLQEPAELAKYRDSVFAYIQDIRAQSIDVIKKSRKPSEPAPSEPTPSE